MSALKSASIHCTKVLLPMSVNGTARVETVADGSGLVGDAQAPLGEHLLDIPKAQGEPSVQPDRVVVKSLITSPETGVKLPKGERSVQVRGNAWAGDNAVARLDL